MGSALDDLQFKIHIDLEEGFNSLGKTAAAMDHLATMTKEVIPSTTRLGNAVRGVEFTSMTSATNGLKTVATAAESTANVLDTVSLAVDGVEHSVTMMAHSTETASTVFSHLSPALHKVAGGAKDVSGAISGTGSMLRVAAGGLTHLAHRMHAAIIVTSLLKSAFDVLMIPINVIWTIGVAAFNALAFALRHVSIAAGFLWKGFAMLASFMVSVAGAAIGLALAVFKVWFIFKGWIGALKVVKEWLGMLPPKMRIVVGGLLLLGAAGKVGSVALGVASVAIRAFGFAARVAANGARLLLLPVLAIRNPMAALRSVGMLAAEGLTAVGLAAVKAANALHRVATAAGRSIASVGSMISGGATKAAIGFALMTAAAVTWGASTAVAAEKNDVIFGTMLKNMNEGKAVVDSLQGTQAAGLFDNTELLNSGRLLFKAGVSAADLAGKTDQLATIAAATSTELNDLSRIYQQGAVTGSFGQDKINQLAERGIDIYHGLEAATGVSGAALQKMISDGKIGLTEMDAALVHLTEGNGIYAGALENIGNTTGGMFSRIKNNAQQTLGQLMGYTLGIFKPMLAAGVAFTEKLKLAVQKLEPAFLMFMTSVGGAMTAGWNAIQEVATGALILIFGEGQLTFDSIITWAAKMLGAATYVFNNIGLVSSYAWKFMQLGAAMAFNDIAYFFTATIPAYLSWFGANWKNVFMDAGNVVLTVFQNMSKNIWAIMQGVWAFIKSGGQTELKFAFVPLLDGFKSTVSELPNVPERAMTELEKKLTADLGEMGAQIGTGISAAMADAVQAVGSQTQTELSGGSHKTGSESAADKANKAAAENKAILVRSSEGQSMFSQLAKAFGKGDTEKRAQKAQIDAAKDIHEIARETRKGKRLASKGF